MKVKHPKKTYEYDTSTMMVNTSTRDKIKLHAAKEKITMKEFVDTLITNYENKSN